MKKLVFLLVLVFPFAAWAEDRIPELADGIYALTVTIEGGMVAGQPMTGGASTVHRHDGMTFEAQTVAYTAMVDAIRDILTKVWALEVKGLDEAKFQELMRNPKVLYQGK